MYPIINKNTTNNSNVTIERKIISFQELIILYRVNDYPKFYLQHYKSFITIFVLNLYIRHLSLRFCWRISGSVGESSMQQNGKKMVFNGKTRSPIIHFLSKTNFMHSDQ
jgi:hypothetical protein